MATVAKCILLKFAPIMPAFCSLLLPSNVSKNYAGKIDTSLHGAQPLNCKAFQCYPHSDLGPVE